MLTHADGLRADDRCAGREENVMSWFSLKDPVGTNWRLNTGDLKNTKRALSQLGYYKVPPERGIDDWADTQLFDGIRSFQKDNGLKVDAFMRPGGPTEKTINARLAFAGATGDDDVERSPRYKCTVCGALHGGVYSPTVCHNCFVK
ncbi:MAG: peptidoglycan-binding domain-containing protein [Pseudomonadota bacterium]